MFIENNFSPVGGIHGSVLTTNAKGVGVYSYITADPLTQVVASQYFNDLSGKLHRGDIIYVGSNQLDDDSSDNEYTIIYVDNSPPSADNITINTRDINAT